MNEEQLKKIKTIVEKIRDMSWAHGFEISDEEAVLLIADLIEDVKEK